MPVSAIRVTSVPYNSAMTSNSRRAG
jgi:hypothetical protein